MRTAVWSLAACVLGAWLWLIGVAADAPSASPPSGLAAGSPPPANAPHPPSFDSIRLVNPTAINMREAGARGDGVTDDSARIQAAIRQAPDNTSFYFPAGTYRVAALAIAHRSRLEFHGDGAATVLRWSGAGLPDGWTPLMTFTGVSDLLIRDMAFDNRSIPSFGGVAFYGTRRVEIRNTRVTDSRPRAPSGRDRYAFVFGHSAVPHEDIRIRDNAISNLQVEVDHARRVEIRNNTVTRGTQTAGIGLFTVASGAVLEDYLIEGNVVIDPEPPASGIAVHLDPPTDRASRFRRIRIANNSIVFRTAGTVGISIGTPYVAARTQGNLFEDLVVEGNLVRVDPAAPAAAELLRVVSNGDFAFTRLHLQGNVLLGNGRLAASADGTAQIRYTDQGSVIAGNALRRSVKGLQLVGLRDTRVTDNVVELESGTAYAYSYSRGGNVLRNNSVLGIATTSMAYEKAPHITDVVERLAPGVPGSGGPVIGNVRVSGITAAAARVSWDTDRPATSEVEYTTQQPDRRTTHPRPPFVQRHQVALDDLRPGTTYTVRVRSIDATGTEAISEGHRFTTLAPEPAPAHR